MPDQGVGGVPSTADLAGNPDFMSASLDSKVQMLSKADPDFADGSPADQMGYITHILSSSLSGGGAQARPSASDGQSAPRTAYRPPDDSEDLIRSDGRASHSSDDNLISSGGTAYRSDGMASPSGFGRVAPAPVAAPQPELTPSRPEKSEGMPSVQGFGSAYVGRSPEQRAEEPTTEDESKATAAREETSSELSQLPKAPTPVQQRQIEENSPGAKAIEVDRALQALFSSTPDQRPGVMPQEAEPQTHQMSQESEDLMQRAHLSQHARTVIRATMNDSELQEMLHRLHPELT
jgi:hypothetical protein